MIRMKNKRVLVQCFYDKNIQKNPYFDYQSDHLINHSEISKTKFKKKKVKPVFLPTVFV